MPDHVRVTDLDTGHKRTVLRGELAHGNYRELKEDPYDETGEPKAPEFNAVTVAAADTKEKN